jgi:NADH dehydrogenase [ubiquinone] 1 alpha subcomplex assembly factor 1
MHAPISRHAYRYLTLSACLLLISMNAQSASDPVLFDFTQETSTAGWQIVNDDVMGGVSASRFELRNGLGRFRGEVSLENNGGFASVRSLPGLHDLTGFNGFIVRVRGDGRRYRFAVRTAWNFDSAIYQAAFETKPGTWQEHRLAFGDFVPTFRGRILDREPPIDPAKVTSVGFLISDKQEGPFQLEVAWIKADH